MLRKIFTKLKSDKRLLALFFFLVFVIGFSITYSGLTISGMISKDSPIKKGSNAYLLASPEPVDNSQKGIFNVLLLGYGGAGHDGGGLMDSIIVLNVNTNTKKYTLISIPRDLFIQGNRKINAEVSVNGYGGTMAAINSITGLQIDHYVAIDFGNYTKMVDALEGITVEVPSNFTDSFYPIAGLENETCGFTENEINNLKTKYSGFELEKNFTCRYETVSYQKGTTTLDGKAALKFVRSRHADGDFARSTRQFAVLKGVLTKLISFKNLDKLDETIGTLFEMVKTDLTLGKIKTLAEVFGNASEYTGGEIHLTTENYLTEGKSVAGAYVLYPKAGMYNYSDIKSFISSEISN